MAEATVGAQTIQLKGQVGATAVIAVGTATMTGLATTEMEGVEMVDMGKFLICFLHTFIFSNHIYKVSYTKVNTYKY